MVKKVYCLKWTGNGVIANNLFFTDLKHAKRWLDKNNKALKWYHRLSFHRWVLLTLKAVEEPKWNS